MKAYVHVCVRAVFRYDVDAPSHQEAALAALRLYRQASGDLPALPDSGVWEDVPELVVIDSERFGRTELGQEEAEELMDLGEA